MTEFRDALRAVPMIRVLLPYLAGVGMGLSFGFLSGFSGMVLVSLSFMVCLWQYLAALKNYRKRPGFGMAVYVALFLAGGFYSSEKLLRITQAVPYPVEGIFQAQVLEPGKQTASLPVAVCQITGVFRNDTAKNSNFHVLVYFPQNVPGDSVHPGRRFCFRGRIVPLPVRMNPEEFDYGRYLKLRGISGRVWIREGNIQWGASHTLSLRAMAWDLRSYLIKVMTRYGISGQELAVLSAMSLGYRDALSEETIQAYSAAGAMHILAVSGLHVGVMYLLFNLFTMFLSRKRWGRILRMILGILFLWGYAFLTGLSPSVVRATTMFSFFMAGNLLNRRANSFNILASAAFVMLVINPLILGHVGFQLSCLAVAGILALYPKLAKLFLPKNRILAYVRSLLSLTIAAQAGTSALSVFYFHQFPAYFFLTNLLVVPLSGTLLYGSVFLFLLSWWQGVAWILAHLLAVFTAFLNHSVSWIESLPGSILTGLWINPTELFFIIAFTILAIVFIYYRRAWVAISFLVCFVVALSIATIRKWNSYHQNMLVVYCVPNHTSIGWIQGKNHYVVADVFMKSTPELLHRKAKNFWTKYGLNEPVFIYLRPELLHGKNNVLEIKQINKGCWSIKNGNFSVIMIDASFPMPATNPNTGDIQAKVDLLILTGEKFIDTGVVFSKFTPGKILTDATVPARYIEKYRKGAVEQGIPFYAVSRQGAFVISL